jgi:pimeloyl-ACP methyl ester carboxylesterase
MSVPKDHSIEFQDRGQGVSVLFVSGSFSTPAAWKPIFAHLKQSYRVIETSLCAYGQTSETRSTGDLAMSHQLDVLANVTAQAATPLHIVGHSFGATIALIFALENPENVLSLTLFEPHPLCFLREDRCFDALSDIDFMYAAFCEAVAQKNPDAARLGIDF